MDGLIFQITWTFDREEIFTMKIRAKDFTHAFQQFKEYTNTTDPEEFNKLVAFSVYETEEKR